MLSTFPGSDRENLGRNKKLADGLLKLKGSGTYSGNRKDPMADLTMKEDSSDLRVGPKTIGGKRQ